MNEDHKQIIRETCKSHSTKVSDREFTRAHPTKLTKQELEDLYYAILDNNLELKQTINTQNEKVKQLSTKVQRLAALQKSGLGRNEKDCCINAKALIREQKDIIAEQKRANDRLSEKNRILNMRLCSAKQFLGKNSARCNKCCLAAAISLKNSSTSALNVSTKRSATNIQTLVSSTDLIHKEPVSTKAIEVQTDCEKTNGEVCNENKCKTLMEELKQKIASLEEARNVIGTNYTDSILFLLLELCKIHSEYLSRVSRLEQEVVVLRQEEAGKTLVLQHAETQSGELLQRLRAAETQCEEIAVQLSAEQRKVCELETRLRAAELTAQVARTVHHYHQTDKLDCKMQEMPATRLSNVEDVKCPNTPKNSDDSGYMEAILLEEQKSPRKEVSCDLREKISELQTQLNSLKRLAAVEIDSEKKLPNFESYDLAIEEDQVSMLKNINDYNNLIKDPLLNLEPLKTGEMFEIKKSESHVMQAKAEETLYENATEPATSVQMSSFQKSSFNLPSPTKGILEKSDDISKGYRKEEKVVKNVSYDDVMSDTDNMQKDMKNPDKTREQPESCSIVGYSPSDDKHFVVTHTIDDQLKDKKNKTERRRSKDENSPTNRSLEIKEGSNGYHKVCRKNKAYKENVFNREKDIKVKEQIKGKKKISIDVPDSDVHLCSKETNMNINTCNSNPSTESSKEIVPSGRTSPKCQYLSQPTDKDGIKVIKDVKSTSDMNVPNPDNTKYPNEEATANEKIKKSKTKRNRNSIEHQIEKFRKNDNKQLEMCEQHAVICTCPRAARREVRVFRTCSGTGRFATVAHSPHDTGMRHCACACATSVSGRSNVSAGEARVYNTCTDTATTTTTTTDCLTLSEGELPHHAHTIGRKLLSPGERRRKTSSGEISPPFSTSQRVEDALQAIGEELARCRALLQRQRPQGKSSKDISCNTEGASDALALRRAEGQARIVAAHSHICHFTLHIGTLVLSDQAVLHSRGKSLLLTWRFYEQSAGLARVPPGRVAHFDLTTEYQLPFTENFLEYMRNEDMYLKICEANKMEEVFASCALPLHDSLLHANRRADMSLPLVAGEEILSSRVVTDALDSGEEAGVLDVWCQLRLDPALLAALRKGSSKAATMSVPASEDQSSVYHLTRELEAKMQRNSKNNKQLTVRSSQEVRQAVANEIRPPSKLRVLVERSSVETNLGPEEQMRDQTLEISVVWLALSEESEAMTNPDVQRLFVAYSFLGREGAELETPVSLPKPKSCNDKCYFNFNKQFVLTDSELPLLGHMARCRRRDSAPPAHTDCLTFAIVSEPPEDPLGLDTCEDIGYAHLYLGDVLARCAGSDSYTEVLSVRARSGAVCGVLAVRLAGLHVLRTLWSVHTAHCPLHTDHYPLPIAKCNAYLLILEDSLCIFTS
ncbi:Protein fantom [Papilio xuthus]|uniref:Protein fantom n=1 Tax=Papilio xuthus TaxID=66420 RepID=A0A194Q4P8_PAPXU|nr:Protein fantom [Papilio xuthus]